MSIAPYCTYYEGKTLVANHVCPKRPEFTNVMGYMSIWSDRLAWQVEQADDMEEDIVYIVTGIRFCPFCGGELHTWPLSKSRTEAAAEGQHGENMG